VSFKFWDIAKW